MVKKKFDELVVVMEQLLMQDGYQKGRKKGTYHKTVSGKIMKLRMILSSVRQRGNLGEVRVFTALEYPAVEEMVFALKGEQYKKGNHIFEQDIGLFCGKRSYAAFHISSSSNMEYVGAMMRAYLVQNVFPLMCDYEDDKKILDKFACNDTIWRWVYFSGGKVDINLYLRWASLCVLTGHIREAFIVLENVPTYFPLKQEIEMEVIKERLGVLCSDKKQVSSRYLLIDEQVIINPGEEELKKAILELDGLGLYYLVLENSIGGNYLQIAGGSGEYTLEIRLYHGQEYTHYRAETKDGDTQEKKIFYGYGNITLQTNQVLSFDQVYGIACKYLAEQELHSAYRWGVLDI